MKGRHWFFILSTLTLVSSIKTNLAVRAEELQETPKREPINKSRVNQDKVSEKKTKAAAKVRDQWRQKMQELYKTLAEVTTDTSSEQRFNDPENRERIVKNAKKLADRAHDMTKKGVSPDLDPTIRILSNLFQDETKRAYSALQSGNRSYARSILSQVSGYCIACHTRNSSGPSFASLPMEPVGKNIYPIEKGRFYAATRQYDRALDLFKNIINDSTSPSNKPLEWEQAVRYGLAISVRAKKDPDESQALVERILDSKRAPFFLKQDAIKWKESIAKWKEEMPNRNLTEEGLRSEAMLLLSQAREFQKFPMDRSADVLYLRASSVIHELLQKSPDGPYAQEAMLMAGMCYDVLRPLNYEDIHEIYYEACINKAPHTPTAEICYKRYEQSTYDGYTGSTGTVLPPDIKKKLQRMEALAHPEKVTEPMRIN